MKPVQQTLSPQIRTGHRIADWLSLHQLQPAMIQDVISATRAGVLLAGPVRPNDCEASQKARIDLGSQQECFRSYVIPAFVDGFNGLSEIQHILNGIDFICGASPQIQIPYTTDQGRGMPPRVALDWRRRVEDLTCLAHEAAHALQIVLSDHDMMPPVARETCAFLGELLLLCRAENHASELFEALMQIWDQENEVYLLDNLDTLADGLLNPETPYQYYMNYPLARLAAVHLVGSEGFSLIDLFSSGASAMKHLPIAEMAAQAATLTNYFPKFPEQNPKLGFYRNMGTVALLDLEANNSHVRSTIQDYYSALQAHHLEDAILIWLSEDQRPMGCATWGGQSNDSASQVTRLTAPFGGHARLQKLLDTKCKPSNSNEFHERGEPV